LIAGTRPVASGSMIIEVTSTENSVLERKNKNMENRASDVASEEILERLRSRGEFLKLLGAAGIGTAAGVSVLRGTAEGAVQTTLQPTDFHFTTRERFRPFHLLAYNFVRLDDRFESNTIGDYTILRPGPPNEDDGFLRVEEGKLRFAGQDDYYTILKSDTGQRAPYASVIIDVASLTEGTVYVGLYRGENNYVHAYYNETTNTVGLEARVNGVLYELGSMQPEASDFGTSFRFAFVANENEVTALVGDRFMDIGDFRPLIKRNASIYDNDTPDPADDRPTGLDLRDVTVLATYKNGFGARSDTGSNILLDRVRAGYFGEAGVRDPHVVQYANGAPYIKDNKLYFTLTNAGLGFFEKAHWGVWTMDLSDYTKIEQVGNIFWTNEGDPNKVLGHHAGQIIRDEAGGRWIVVASSWGDFGPQGGDAIAGGFGIITYPDEAPTYEPPVDILYAAEPDSLGGLPLTTNILVGVHVLTGKKHPVNNTPFPTEGKWDPGLTRIGGRWYLSYVIALDLFGNFQPALARSPVGADHTAAVQFVGADWEKRATEGPVIQKLGGEWRLFASCGDDEPEQFQNRYPIYFLNAANPGAPDDLRPRDTNPERLEPPTAEEESLRRLAFDGYLDAPHPTNIPHPMIVPISITSGGRRRTKYIMITFNGDQFFERVLGYGTHGDFFVMQADQTVAGWEFSPR
jgi:hypothetical protein